MRIAKKTEKFIYVNTHITHRYQKSLIPGPPEIKFLIGDKACQT